MRTIETVIIGGGQAGLACSRHLTAADRPHVVLERGRVGDRWCTDTWASLHLLSPNWMNALPGAPYRGPDPDGFLSAAAFVRHLVDYALSFGAPVQEMTDVLLVRRRGERFEVLTDDGGWRAEHVVLATGWCDLPAVPDIARDAARDIYQLAPKDYRDPAGLPPGGVLVVGASSTGVQLADELRRPGATSRSPSAATAGCRAATAAWTSSGGSTGSACSTGRSTRYRTCGRRVPSRPCNWPGGPTTGHSTSPHSRRTASGWWAG